jgi:Family of unknown function (DUF5677)
MEDRLVNTFESLVANLEIQVLTRGNGSFTTDGLFRCVVRAAMVKATEFAKTAGIAQAEPFFLTATLRGICEDLIVLSFISGFDDRDEIVHALNENNVAEALRRQRVFFIAERPWQPVITDVDGHLEKVAANLKDIAKRHGWKRRGQPTFPTVREMAKQRGLLPLYEFMYAATSQWVHCTPHLLLRMGWSNGQTGRTVSDETNWSFSTKHFKKYYAEFNRVYSAYLLTLLLRQFLDDFEQKQEVSELLDKLVIELNGIIRWPELVTHEELNLEPPGVLMRFLLRAQAEESENEGAP